MYCCSLVCGAACAGAGSGAFICGMEGKDIDGIPGTECSDGVEGVEGMLGIAHPGMAGAPPPAEGAAGTGATGVPLPRNVASRSADALKIRVNSLGPDDPPTTGEGMLGIVG